jgi:hypothetical protein
MVVSRHETLLETDSQNLLSEEDSNGALDTPRKIIVRVGSSYGLGLRRDDGNVPALTGLPTWKQLKFELWLQWELAAPLLVQGFLQVRQVQKTCGSASFLHVFD